jgi:hypothetical protein
LRFGLCDDQGRESELKAFQEETPKQQHEQNSVPFKKREWPNLSPRDYLVQGLDSAAALLTHQGVAAATGEERFSRE